MQKFSIEILQNKMKINFGRKLPFSPTGTYISHTVAREVEDINYI